MNTWYATSELKFVPRPLHLFYVIDWGVHVTNIASVNINTCGLYWRQQNISHCGTRLKKLDDESRCGFWWGKVVCFVLSCWNLPNRWVGVHQLGLRLFGVTVWKFIDYWIISFCEWKLNKTETEDCIGIWGCSWCCWKAFNESDLIEFISQFSELRCERYWIFSGFCCWKFKQSSKNGFGRKNQLSPQCVHIAKFINF